MTRRVFFFLSQRPPPFDERMLSKFKEALTLAGAIKNGPNYIEHQTVDTVLSVGLVLDEDIWVPP